MLNRERVKGRGRDKALRILLRSGINRTIEQGAENTLAHKIKSRPGQGHVHDKPLAKIKEPT